MCKYFIRKQKYEIKMSKIGRPKMHFPFFNYFYGIQVIGILFKIITRFFTSLRVNYDNFS